MSVKRSLKSVEKVVNKQGENITFTELLQTSFDPITGQKTKSENTHIVKGVPTRYKATEVDDTRVLSTDLKLLVAPFEPIPERDWKVSFNGNTYTIKDIKYVRKQGVNVLLILQVGL